MADNTLNKGPRIAWIDIYKGIAICLVVVGHATGAFNSYIYQFHMAAFFFISGYTASKKDKSVLKTIWDAFYALLLPYLSVFISMVFVTELLTKLGLYKSFFTPDMIYPGIGNSITQLILHGNCYMWLLGAGWFVTVLFAIRILHIIVLKLSGENTAIYFLLVGVLYIIGYYIVTAGYYANIGLISIDLACIGVGFYGLGFLFRQENVFEKISAAKTVQVLIFILNICILLYFSTAANTVNYPTRKFNSPASDFLMGLNGCFLLYFASNVIGKIKYLNKLFITLGQNTLGIVFFHFQFFKIGFFFLYLMNIVPLAYIREFLPTEEISRMWWWCLSAISILMSTLEWKILTTVRGLRFFFGTDKKTWDKIYFSVKNLFAKRKIVLPDNLLQKWSRRLREHMKNPWIISGLAVVCLTCIPLWNQGIMCNDELQYYHWSRQGFLAALTNSRISWLDQGRFLTTLFTPIWMYISMIGENICEYRIIPVFTILLNVILFCFLLYRLFKNKNFSMFCGFLLLALLQISFAPVAPNAYTTTFGIPFSFLLGAMIMYVGYIDNPSKRIRKILICLSMLIAFTTYEIFVTYVPLFCGIALLKKGCKNIKELTRICLLPVLTGVGYLILYILCRINWPSNYMGTSIGFTLKGALEILVYLCKVSFPGSFLANPTCKYLNMIYHELQLIDYVRIIFLTIGLVCLLCKLVSLGKHTRQESFTRTDVYILLVAFAYCVLPALPLAISSMYQNNVGEDTGFIALPTTYFTYFAGTFLCCYLLWKLLTRLRETMHVILLSLLVVLLCVPVQYMNSNFSIVQNNNFVRLQNIEKFLCTNTVSGITDGKIYSSDIFETKLSLGVHTSYWQDEMLRQGRQIQVIPYLPETVCEKESYFLSYIEDDYFVLEGSHVIYFALTMPEEEKIIELQDGTLMKVKLDGPIVDNGYYIYKVEK